MVELFVVSGCSCVSRNVCRSGVDTLSVVSEQFLRDKEGECPAEHVGECQTGHQTRVTELVDSRFHAMAGCSALQGVLVRCVPLLLGNRR
ncbi:Unannotated [Lentimonas sp. CC4]|nr:Unannotated [Lentimonas sp. CC4]CAA6687017.1 Unannotated [Lentimonas sp. CC6]CAA7075860.1 Unannotated [Lentimonas sp. CC4]CAA7172014.1 Unannotated [Lentimonas sp. CC21]CAA7182923.1 Unannotated [Lentimonas sp. CC8]